MEFDDSSSEVQTYDLTGLDRVRPRSFPKELRRVSPRLGVNLAVLTMGYLAIASRGDSSAVRSIGLAYFLCLLVIIVIGAIFRLRNDWYEAEWKAAATEALRRVPGRPDEIVLRPEVDRILEFPDGAIGVRSSKTRRIMEFPPELVHFVKIREQLAAWGSFAPAQRSHGRYAAGILIGGPVLIACLVGSLHSTSFSIFLACALVCIAGAVAGIVLSQRDPLLSYGEKVWSWLLLLPVAQIAIRFFSFL